jgi:HAMP domain-containing protein
MLVTCEDCTKKFNIDETRIQREKAQFICSGCGNVVIVTKPQKETSLPEKETTPEENSTSKTPLPTVKVKGIPVRSYIFMAMFMSFLVIAAAFSYLYIKYIPGIIYNQVDLRTSAITESFSGVVTKPLLLRNYLQVNKDAQRTSKLPGAAYAAVINKKGIVVAGYFSDLTRFDREFEIQVKEKGFPTSVLSNNKLGTGNSHSRISIGGQPVYDTVVAIPDSGGEVHVGIYLSEVDEAIRKAMISPETLSVAGVTLLLGIIILILLSRTITRPMQELTDVANRISLGELDLTISPSGPRETRELGAAFERMRFSIKTAVDRMK